MDFCTKPKKRIVINITSLVDILIVLLLFFMLTTQFIRMEVLHLNLAGADKSGNTSGDYEEPAITITLIGNRKFLLDGNEFNLIQLKDTLRPILKESPKSPIILLSQSKASVQDVVSAMDYAKAVGGNNIYIQEDDLDAAK